MVSKTAPKTAMDVVGELVSLLARVPVKSPEVQAKIDELRNTTRRFGALPPYSIALDAAKDAREQVFGVMLGNLPPKERLLLKDRFEEAFRQEFKRLSPESVPH